MTTETTGQKVKVAGGAAEPGSAPTARSDRAGPIARLASVRLTLWLLAALVIAMSVASVIPQNAPTEAYVRAFGEVAGGFIARTTLHNIYGCWWFIGAFVLLALNLLACILHRSMQLAKGEREAPARVTREDTQARGYRAAWRTSMGVEETAGTLSAALKKRGFAVRPAEGEEDGQRGLVARRGRLGRWTAVIVHIGMLIILIGAGWGRLPRNGYQTLATLQPGGEFSVKLPDDSFGIRLLSAGSKQDAMGQPTDFWAKVEVLQGDSAARSLVIRPNHPLRYHGISVVLDSIGSGAPAAPAEIALEVVKGGSREQVPISITSDGDVEPMKSYRRLHDPPWIVIVTGIRMGDESGKGGPMANVMIDNGAPAAKGQMPQHEWQSIGWIGESGTDVMGVHLRLVHGEEAAQSSAAQATTVRLKLDRDIGLPIVYAGFIIIALGTVLLLSNARGNAVALIARKGQGSQVFVGASRSGSAKSVESLLELMRSETGAATGTRLDE
ncbi:MAG: cytochrome c biogenesis protein ResB [Armatimonadota bacterium]